MASSKRDINIVVLGPTGSGKSRLCNYLLEDDTAFEVDTGFRSVTPGIQSKWTSVRYKDELLAMNFVDTQGLADGRVSNNQLINIVEEALYQDIRYVNYFVIVLKPGQMTGRTRNALEYIIKAFKLDDNERKKHVLLLLSHCECAHNDLIKKYEDECRADRTLKRLLINENDQIINQDCIGLPQPDEVNHYMYDGIIRVMKFQRESLINRLCQPIVGIQPVKRGIFKNLCTIL